MVGIKSFAIVCMYSATSLLCFTALRVSYAAWSNRAGTVIKHFLFISILLLCSSNNIYASVLDWDTLNWPTGSLTQTYPLGGGNVTITFSGDVGAITTVPDGSPGAPEENNFQTGGLVPAENSLFLRMDFPEGTPAVDEQSISVTYAFSHPGGIRAPAFTIFDIDSGLNQWQDVAIASAVRAGGAVVTPTLITTGAANTSDGVDTVTGSAGAGNTSADGNVTFLFDYDDITSFTFTYRNNAPNTAGSHNQWAAMHDIIFNPPSVETKVFSPNAINVNGVSTLTLTLTNPDPTLTATLTEDLVDDMPAGVTIASPANIGGTCPGTVNATAGGSTLTYTSGSQIPANSSCTISVDVTSSTIGTYTNTIPLGSLVTDLGDQSSLISTDLIVTGDAPMIAKNFAPDDIDMGDTSTLTLSLRNPNAFPLTGVAVSDTYPVGDMVNATPANAQTTCGGTVTAVDGGADISLTGATIPASDSCSITVDITSTSVGTHTNTTSVISSDNALDSATASDDLTVNSTAPVCPAGTTLTTQAGNAVLATETGNVASQGQATAAIEPIGTNANTANSALLRNTNDELILDLGELVPTNGVVTISIARQQDAASVIIEDSEDGVAYSGGQVFNAGPNVALQRISYVVTAAAGARFIRFTNQNNFNMFVDGVEYSQICDPPPPSPSCPAGTTVTAQVANAITATGAGDVISVMQAAGGLEALGTASTNANSANLRSTNAELVLDLGGLVPSNSIVTISIARVQTNAIVLIEDSEDGSVYSGGQFFGNGPNTALQRIDYVITTPVGARFIRFTNQNANNMRVDGVEFSQVCNLPLSCPTGTTLTTQAGNAVSATETGNVINEGQATGAITALGTTASAANSAELRNNNDELILDIGELVPTNGVITTSLTRNQTGSVVLIENSEDGIAYSGGQIVNVGPNNLLQRIYYSVTLASGAQFLRFTNQNGNDIWVDGVEYNQICFAPDVADLSITKTDSSGTYTPGGSASYEIVVTNNGPDDVVGAVITDNLPDGVTLSAAWTCSESAGSSCSAVSGGVIGGSVVSLSADILDGGVITVTVPVNFSSNMGDY